MARTTYKSIVVGLLETDSWEWVERLLKANGIEFKWSNPEIKEIEYHNGHYTYGCYVRITLPDYHKVTLEVGGAVDDLIGISHSVIWNENRSKILWMSQRKTREQLGIEEFKIA